MKYLKHIAVTGFFLLVFVNAFAQVKVSLKADTNQIMIGDYLPLQFELTTAPGVRFQYPVWNDTLNRHFEILETGPVDTVIDNNKIKLKQRLTVTSYDSGLFYIPPVHIDYMSEGDTAKHFAESDPVPVTVIAPAVDLQKEFIDIKKPLDAKFTIYEILPYLLGGLLLLALLILAGIYLYKMYKRKKARPKPERPPLPPKEWAVKQLEELRLKKLWQQGREKEYFTELVDILREYMYHRFGVDAYEKTSSEMIEAMRDFNINKEAMQKLEETLQLADLVKFAKFIPTPLECDTALMNSIDFVVESDAGAKMQEQQTENINQPAAGNDTAGREENDNENREEISNTTSEQKEDSKNV